MSHSLQVLRILACTLTAVLVAPGASFAVEVEALDELRPGMTIEIPFSLIEVPPSLHSMMTGAAAPPTLTAQLPDDYVPTESYPLLVYLPGNDGGPKGNIDNARRIAGPSGWIVASLPLFKTTVDRGEPGGGVIVSFEDYPTVSRAYRAMLGKLIERVPNIDRDDSAMVGFSNGAITIGVLVSNHDDFILSNFKNFCLVDHGMFHLADLHKSGARDGRYLILVGDRDDLGRELKIRQSRLQQDVWQMLDVNLSYRILKDTGHEFNQPQMAIVGEWLRGKAVAKPESRSQPAGLENEGDQSLPSRRVVGETVVVPAVMGARAWRQVREGEDGEGQRGG
jgi:predicted esterase